MISNESPFKGKTGLRRLINAAGYSLAGTMAAWRFESAFRQVVLMAGVGIGIAFVLDIPNWGRVAIVFAHLMCVVVELLNSGLEAAVDYTSLDLHPLAKRAKDMGSAAQFFSLSNLAAIWVLVLFG